MARSRDRLSAKGLLPLMEARPWRDGTTVTYRYHPIGGKPINLGTDKHAAIRRVLELNSQRLDRMGTLQWVWEQYQESHRWQGLTEGTRGDYRLAWKQIDAILGHMLIRDIDSTVVARYVHIERAKSPRRADIEKALLSRLFGHGIKLGVCTHNGTIGVEPHGGGVASKAPDEVALKAFLGWLERQTPQRAIVGMMAEYAALAGNRRVEFLDLAWPQIDEATSVIRVKRAKQRGAKRGEVVEIIEITPAMAGLLDRLRAVREARGVDCLYVFPNRDNNPYTSRSFMTLWTRCWADAVEAKVVAPEQRFRFHDLRAYYTTVHKRTRGELPDLHANPEVTARVYDRNREVPRKAL
ncbi:MAG: integrase [Betaproteobacteria bacterium]|nr:integrase [Betaproteobacteria bacterium]